MRFCIYCGDEFHEDDMHRADKNYCERSSCRAKYHMSIGREYRGNVTEHLIHEEKPHVHPFVCVVCGEPFDVNDYAKRGGKREPLYCGRACKQKAYRERLKEYKG